MLVLLDSANGDGEKVSNSEAEIHFKQWRNLVEGAYGDEAEFVNFFNAAKDIDENRRNGWLDFSYHILKPEVLRILGDPGDCTALEIGYGGGRLISHASHLFKRCVGVDIHPFRDYVAELVRDRGGSKVNLFQNDGKTLPVEDESIDFVYSFVVLQHLPSVSILKSYLCEIRRVLAKNGVAILYFGYMPRRLFKNRIELSDMEVKAVSEVTLRISMPLGRKLAREAGLKVREATRSRKKPWADYYGGQFYQIMTPGNKSRIRVAVTGDLFGK